MLPGEILKKEINIHPILFSVNKFLQIIFCAGWLYVLYIYYYDIRYSGSGTMLALVLVSSFFIVAHLVLLMVSKMTNIISLFTVLNVGLFISNMILLYLLQSSDAGGLISLIPYIFSCTLAVINIILGIISIIQFMIQILLKRNNKIF